LTRALVLALLCCSSLLLAQTPDPKPLSPLEQQLIAAEKSLPEAQLKKDGAALKRLFAEDFSQVSIDGKLRDREEIIGMMTEFTVKQFRQYDFKVLPVSDNVAIVTYDAIMEVAVDDDEIQIPRYQHMSSVWVKQGEQWRLKFQQATATQ
jgi:uncharacterized protein (TIGR02246 family)